MRLKIPEKDVRANEKHEKQREKVPRGKVAAPPSRLVRHDEEEKKKKKKKMDDCAMEALAKKEYQYKARHRRSRASNKSTVKLRPFNFIRFHDDHVYDECVRYVHRARRYLTSICDLSFPFSYTCA